jgi:hypothetical protein
MAGPRKRAAFSLKPSEKERALGYVEKAKFKAEKAYLKLKKAKNQRNKLPKRKYKGIPKKQVALIDKADEALTVAEYKYKHAMRSFRYWDGELDKLVSPIKGKKIATDFYDENFDYKAVPTKQLTRFKNKHDELVVLIKDRIDQVGSKNPKLKAYLSTQLRKVQAEYALLRKKMQLYIKEDKQEFIEDGTDAYATEHHNGRDFFGSGEERANLETDKTRAGKWQRDFNTQVKKMVQKSIDKIQKMRAQIFDRV